MSADAPVRDRPTMTLWRLELLRLFRTHRWMILAGTYLLFGVMGALAARYMGELMAGVGGEITIEVPEPRPVDGISQFIGNAAQLGVLAVVVVATAALASAAQPERAAFLRARVARPGRLVVAPYVVNAAAAGVALVLGTAVAAGLTGLLIGGLPLLPLLVGTAYGVLYLAFAVAVVAAVAGYLRSHVGTIFGALGALLLLPLLGMVDPLAPWLPSELVTAVIDLLEGAPATAYLRAGAVAVVATAGLLSLAVRRSERREL